MTLPRSMRRLSSQSKGSQSQSFMPISRSSSTKTGVCSRSARSKAGRAEVEALVRVFRQQHDLLGVAMAGIGAPSTSDCWVRVGMPVLGPARWTSKIDRGDLGEIGQADEFLHQ